MNKEKQTLLKWEKNTCSMENDATMYIGKWVADGTQLKPVISMDENGNPIYNDNYDNPYTLNINPDYSYLLEFHDKENRENKGTYDVDFSQISFTPNHNGFMWYCKLEEEELHCNLYATTFKKEK